MNIKQAKRLQRKVRLKRKLKNIELENLIGVSFAIAAIIGMAAGFITILNTPMGRFDTPFIRFLEFVLYTLGGLMAGAGTVFLLLVLGVCFVAIVRFISDLRG